MSRRNLPPIEGLPAVAQKCAGCGKPLKPWTKDTWERQAVPNVTGLRDVLTHRRFDRWDCYRGLFHSLRCGVEFAAAAHAAGYRRKDA